MSRAPAALVPAVVVLVAVALALPGAAAATNEMSMSGFSEEPGETGLVLLSAQATNVTAYEANVTFDPDVVTVVAAGRQDFPNPEETVDRERGWVRLSAEQSEPVDDPVLASLVVRVLSEAEPGTETELSFVEADTTLTNATDGELSIAAYGNATIDVLQSDTPTPTVAPESTSTLTPERTPTATPTVTTSPTPTPTATPTLTPTPSATQTPTQTETARPTETATSTRTSTASPTPTVIETTDETETTAPPAATPTATPEPTPTDPAAETTTETGPGFGLVVTVLAVLAATGLLRRTRNR
jgi:PGF-CTERM protein